MIKNNFLNRAGTIYNLDYLCELSRGNNQFVKEMICIFLEENPVEIQLLKKAICEKKYFLIKSSIHKFKSSFPFVGLDKVLKKEIDEIELLAIDKSNIQRIKQIFSKIKKMCEKVCHELICKLM